MLSRLAFIRPILGPNIRYFYDRANHIENGFGIIDFYKPPKLNPIQKPVQDIRLPRSEQSIVLPETTIKIPEIKLPEFEDLTDDDYINNIDDLYKIEDSDKEIDSSDDFDIVKKLLPK